MVDAILNTNDILADDLKFISDLKAILYTAKSKAYHNYLMNMLAAIGAYCFFSIKLEVNFDFEIPEANGQLVLWQ